MNMVTGHRVQQRAFEFIVEPPVLMGEYSVGVVGATGAVGRTVIQILHERQFSVGELHLYASPSSVGETAETEFGQFPLETLELGKLPHLDIVFMAAGSSVAKQWGLKLARRGALVIDKSSYFRSKPHVPLIVPEVNRHDIFPNKGVISNPNCTTIPLVTVLKPLDDLFGLKRVTASSYQSVSGSGRDGINTLNRELQDDDAPPSGFAHRIAHNIIPWIGSKGRGISGEEVKLVQETRKIMNRPRLAVRSTSVRVPTFVGHGLAVHADFEKKVDVARATAALRLSPGVKVVDNPESDDYPTPLMAAGTDWVYVGRIRKDTYHRGLAMWIVADNLRKGAATNAVQIAESYLELKQGSA